MDTTAKTLVFWIAFLATAILLYGIVQHRTLHAVTTHPISTARRLDYSIVPVGPSADDLRSVLESKGNERWELAAPVVNNGTTTALIFKRERK
jgi:hypothetical protein